MGFFYGDEVSDEGPIKYLVQQGFTRNSDFTWSPKPGVKSYDDMSWQEYYSVMFLMDEWDWGGVIF